MAIWRSGQPSCRPLAFWDRIRLRLRAHGLSPSCNGCARLDREHLACFPSEDFAHVGAEAPPLRIAAGMQRRCRRALKRSSLTKRYSALRAKAFRLQTEPCASGLILIEYSLPS
jgi:hypothetical protein